MDNISSIRRDLKSSIKQIQEKKTLVLISCISIILLTLLFFKLTFEKKNETIVEKYRDTLKKNPHIKRDLQPLSNCKEIKNDYYDYKLADYYISSSFNSPLIGNQKRDYLSLEFFKEVIDSGARYLEFQINPSSTNDFPEPIVGTGDINNNWGNSMNFLKLDDVLKTIRQSAFNNKMNYPLIIYLDFNSSNKHLLKRTGELINAYLGDYVVNNGKYVKIPFIFEKICLFNRKILFLSSLNNSNFMMTPLETIVLPELGFVRRVYYDDIGKQLSVEKTLSKKSQMEDNDKFNENYKTYEDIIGKVNDNKGTSFYDILVEEEYENPLLHFNKVGLTLIIPHKKEDNFTLNFEPQSYWDNGCQIVAMNFQESLERNFLDKINNPIYKLTNNDPIIIRYLSKFNKNSFILKSDEERFIEISTEIKPTELFNIDKDETREIKINTNFINNYVSEDNDQIKVCMIQSYAHPNYYLDSNSGIIKFINKDDNNNDAKSMNDYLFMFVNSKDENLYNKTAISIIPINNIVNLNVSKRKVLTRNSEDFAYRTVSNNSYSLIKKSSFYPVHSTCSEIGDTVSFKIISDSSSSYLGYNDKILTTYIKNDTNKMKESCCFNIIHIPYNYTSKAITTPKQSIKLFLYIKHQYSGRYFKKSDDSNFCIFKDTVLKDTDINNKFEIIMENYNLKEPFNLKINNTFLKYSITTNKLSVGNTNDGSSFKLTNNDDTYNLKLMNQNGDYNRTLNNINNIPIFNLNNSKENTYVNKSLSCYIKFELV